MASLGGGSSSTAGAPAASSRFNLDAMEEKKAPAFQRGKDGHLTLNTGDDFFSNPMGGSSRQASLGEGAPRQPASQHSAVGPLCCGHLHVQVAWLQLAVGAATLLKPLAPPPAASHSAAADRQASLGAVRAYGGMGGSGPPKGKQPAAPAAEGPGAAQQRFGNAKSISSSAFHGQDSKESDYERNQRLQQFQVRGAAGCAAASWQKNGACLPGCLPASCVSSYPFSHPSIH